MKNLKVTVNGLTYDVKVEEIDENDNVEPKDVESAVQNTGQKDTNVNNQSSPDEAIKSPMPGTVVSVNVNKGDKVKKGDVLLILEAMKMENEITSPRDAIISEVNVKKGQSVDSGLSLVFLK